MKQNIDNDTERLRIRVFSDEMVPPDYRTLRVFSSDSETVEILTAQYSGSRWGLGYNIMFADGRSSYLPPSLARGYFRSEQDAVFYMLKYFLTFRSYFSDKAVSEFLLRLPTYGQKSIF